MNDVGVIQHTEGEFLGLLEDHFESRAIGFTYHRPFVPGGRLPLGPSEHATLLLLGGGPLGAVSGDLLPTLAPELRLIRAFLAEDRAVIGFGLGAVLLAIAAGGGAETTPLRFDVTEASRVAPHALAGFLPERYPLVRYGRDRAVLPPAAQVLATAADGTPALFQLGGKGFGFAGHPGIKRGMIEDVAMTTDPTPADLAQGLDALGAAQRAVADALGPIATGLAAVCGLMEGR